MGGEDIVITREGTIMTVNIFKERMITPFPILAAIPTPSTIICKRMILTISLATATIIVIMVAIESVMTKDVSMIGSVQFLRKKTHMMLWPVIKLAETANSLMVAMLLNALVSMWMWSSCEET